MKKTKKKTKKNKSKKGFTLIELLVVVAIIGILAGIVLVSLTSARQRTVKASLQSTMASVVGIANMCVNDDGTVQSPTDDQAGGGTVCSLADYDETWPALPAQVTAAGYQYMTMSDATLIAGDGTNAVVTCTVATGSCVLN